MVFAVVFDRFFGDVLDWFFNRCVAMVFDDVLDEVFDRCVFDDVFDGACDCRVPAIFKGVFGRRLDGVFRRRLDGVFRRRLDGVFGRRLDGVFGRRFGSVVDGFLDAFFDCAVLRCGCCGSAERLVAL